MKKIIYLFLFFAVNFSFGQDFSSNVRSYLEDYQKNSSLTQSDISDVSISTQSYSKSLKGYNVYVEQYYQGIKIYNSVSPFFIKSGKVESAKLSFIGNLSSKVNSTSPSISALAAISKASNSLDLQAPQGLNLLDTKDNYSYVFSKGGISQENIPVQLVYHRVNDNQGLKLAWDLSIYVLDGSHYYSVRIDALTGELLASEDWVLSCDFGDGSVSHANAESILFANGNKDQQPSILTLETPSYRVFPLPLIGPNEGPSQLLSDPSNALASPFGWHDSNGVVGPEYTTSRGNNVFAREDHDGNNSGGTQAEGGPTLQFDFPYDLPNNPLNFTSAAITNLFYMNNVMHDVFYNYGFDEPSGNFQLNNYGNGGNQGDYVIAEAQDGSGLNNANFATGADGISGRMQMYLWTAPGAVLGTYLTINNGPLAGSYYARDSEFAPSLPITPITADLVLLMDDNSGVSEDPNDGCDALVNASSLSGKIAVIRRGTCEFVFKAQQAQDAGAIAVIMVNNDLGDPIIMGGTGTGITIPAIMVYKTDGEAIIASLINGDTINATLVDDGSGTETNKRDGDLDNVIVAHEYGHGISVRLTGGRFNSGCLMNQEQMGEGWSDYFALMLTIKSTDNGDEPRGIGNYALGQGTGGAGLRSQPYSTNTSRNNYTYNSIKYEYAPHGVGSVWTQMLWDMTWAFINEYGFDPDLYDGTGGNNMALQLVVDALKLQPCSPGFVDGRDAILEADEIANGGANKCLIWNVFANRGLGFSADQGSTDNKMDGTEAFDMPPECLVGVVDRSLENNFIIYPNPSQGDLSIRSKFEMGETEISIYDMNGRKVFYTEVDLYTETNLNVGSLGTGIYLIKIDGGGYSQTSKLIIN